MASNSKGYYCRVPLTELQNAGFMENNENDSRNTLKARIIELYGVTDVPDFAVRNDSRIKEEVREWGAIIAPILGTTIKYALL
jgi:hypothetical protein